MTLERELAVYHEHLPHWLAEGRRGQWVAIYQDTVIGFYRDREAACSAADEESLSSVTLNQVQQPALVKQISDEPEPVRYCSRNVAGQQKARDAQVRAEEREACARLCEGLADQEVAKLVDTPNVGERTRDYHQARIQALRRAAQLIREHAERERLFGQMEERLAEDGGVWPDDRGPGR